MASVSSLVIFLSSTCEATLIYIYLFFSGMDITHGCMPNKFSHILFGKLKSLSDNPNHLYRSDRIYIKPEQYGLQQFQHYLGRKWITFTLSRLPMFLIFRLEPLYSSGITFFSVSIRRSFKTRFLYIRRSVSRVD